MFTLDQPYEETDPQVIRSDFAELGDLMGSADLLHRLACYVNTDTLRSFMDDLAMGRV